MAKYIVKYKFNGKERSVKRIADNAEEAIDHLVNQYSWSWKLSMEDLAGHNEAEPGLDGHLN